mgnify:FL=1
MMGEGFGMGFGGGFMWLTWLVLAVGLALVLKYVAFAQENRQNKQMSALETLEERYPPGEIGREEFHQTKGDLLK